MNYYRAIRQLRQTIGLEPSFSDYIAPAVGLVAVGMLAGAGAALLFAPSSGEQLRKDLDSKFNDLRTRFLQEEAQVKNGLRAAANNAANHVSSSQETYPRG